jgi:hypothetical protein
MRYRVEIYDDIKSNDLTIESPTLVDKEYLTELVFSNLNKFSGNVKAFVYDNVKKKKVTALVLPYETVSKINNKRAQLTSLLV